MSEAGIRIDPQLICSLRQAAHVVVLSGSGISAESGVPTFRDAQSGLWADYQPEQLATPEAFIRNPRLVWDWYAWRRELVARAQPNPAHFALAELQRRTPRLTLITQNVDGLHQRAGSDGVIEFHGSLQRVRCQAAGHIVEEWSGDVTPPLCPVCPTPTLLRPDVVWFGEAIDEGHLRTAFAAAAGCDVLLSVGTSSVVQPAASIANAALQSGAVVVEINPASTPLSTEVTYALRGAAGVMLPALLAALADGED